jgi:hypothetical protein
MYMTYPLGNAIHWWPTGNSGDYRFRDFCVMLCLIMCAAVSFIYWVVFLLEKKLFQEQK